MQNVEPEASPVSQSLDEWLDSFEPVGDEAELTDDRPDERCEAWMAEFGDAPDVEYDDELTDDWPDERCEAWEAEFGDAPDVEYDDARWMADFEPPDQYDKEHWRRHLTRRPRPIVRRARARAPQQRSSRSGIRRRARSPARQQAEPEPPLRPARGSGGVSAEDTEALRGWAAMRLTRNLDVYESILARRPVRVGQLEPEVLLLARRGMPLPPPDEWILIRDGHLDAIAEAGPEGPEPVADGQPPDVELRIVSAAEFAAVDEPGAAAILGDRDGAADPRGRRRDVLRRRRRRQDDALDRPRLPPCRRRRLARHPVAAAGARPARRESRGRGRSSGASSSASSTLWRVSPLDDRLQVLEEPWAAFSFADQAWRDRARRRDREREIDVVIVGPLTSLGMETAGTIAETSARSSRSSPTSATCSESPSPSCSSTTRTRAARSPARGRAPATRSCTSGAGARPAPPLLPEGTLGERPARDDLAARLG